LPRRLWSVKSFDTARSASRCASHVSTLMLKRKAPRAAFSSAIPLSTIDAQMLHSHWYNSQNHFEIRGVGQLRGKQKLPKITRLHDQYVQQRRSQTLRAGPGLAEPYERNTSIECAVLHDREIEGAGRRTWDKLRSLRALLSGSRLSAYDPFFQARAMNRPVLPESTWRAFARLRARASGEMRREK
jgi:hypothetical protein